MRFLVIAIPRTTPTPDVLPGLLEAGEAWYERYEDYFEAFGIFPGGGGFGIVDLQKEADLHRLIAEMPFSAYSEIKTWSYVDGRTGWKQAREAVTGLLASL